MLRITPEILEETMLFKGYTLFRGDWSLNLIGLRTADSLSNRFNDLFLIFFRCAESWSLLQFPCTTDPGTYYRNNPINIDGTAIVVPNQYRGLWKLGKHRGLYDALIQKGPVQVYRDNNLDNVIDLNPSTVQEGMYGINCHRANTTKSSQVDRWSAGCQVLQAAQDFDVLLSLCNRSSAMYGNSFSYTLLTEQDIKQ
jgi:hypothetical protein